MTASTVDRERAAGASSLGSGFVARDAAGPKSWRVNGVWMRRLAYGLMAVGALGLLVEGWAWQRTARWNRAIEATTAPSAGAAASAAAALAPVHADLQWARAQSQPPAEWALAEALSALAAARTAGPVPPAAGSAASVAAAASEAASAPRVWTEPRALRQVRALQTTPGPVGQVAAFNAANHLLREAEALRAAGQEGQAMALAELGKEQLRSVLRAAPSHWAARYNLERAQWLLADPEPGETLLPSAPENAERAATTMRGTAQGLP